MIPKKVFFVKGKGYHKSKLGSFEQALRDAGIAQFNLVEVSSILPPDCVEITKEDGVSQLQPGQIVYTVLSRISSNEKNQLISTSIGVAHPKNQKTHGYLSEYHAYDIKPEIVGEFSEDLATEMLATTLGISFDPEANYDEKRETFRMNGKKVETKNITQSTRVREKKEWATVIAAAIFIL